MPHKYVVTLTHAGGTEDLEISEEGVITWTGGDPPVAVNIRQRERFIRSLRLVSGWLHTNGGTKLEVEEVEI